MNSSGQFSRQQLEGTARKFSFLCVYYFLFFERKKIFLETLASIESPVSLDDRVHYRQFRPKEIQFFSFIRPLQKSMRSPCEVRADTLRKTDKFLKRARLSENPLSFRDRLNEDPLF